MSLENLNPDQEQAVKNSDGPVMILAGAGSGKTRTLVARIIHILQTKDVGPYQILAMTFSNKAAKEMRERVMTKTGLPAGTLQITTFHSFCSRVLRSEYNYLGLGKNFTIYDDSESKSVVKNILTQRKISFKDIPPQAILYFIEEVKNRGLYLGLEKNDDEWEELSEHEYFSFYRDYEKEIHKSNAVDFGGLITGVLNLFRSYPEVLERYQNKYTYILVDEYQDTNRAQFELLKLLRQKNDNICVVGDEDQSIYSWRGADIQNIINFEETFVGAKLIKLEQNYRSSQTIISGASALISHNKCRKGKVLWTDNAEGDLISVIECSTDKQEGEFVVGSIKDLKESKKANYSDMAIFYRNNSQSRTLEDTLRNHKIPYRIVGGIKFYERKEIKDLISYLKLIVNSDDSLALTRVINSPPRGIGATTIRKLEGLALDENCSLWQALIKVVENPENYSHIRLSRKVKSNLLVFIELIEAVKLLEKAGETPSSCYEKLLEESGYVEYLKASKDYESMARIDNLQELLNAIKQYEDGRKNPTIIGFLESISLDNTTGLSPEEEEKNQYGEVVLMTVHSSKGLEFPYVYLVGAEENLFPSYKSLEDGEMGVEEERRLFYVAMTRAMEKLFICFCQGRMLFGSLKFNGPSRFLQEIPSEYVNWRYLFKEDVNRYQNHDIDNDYDDYNQYGGHKSQSKNKGTFPQGSQVVHSLYGEGTILEVYGSGNDEKVLILFRGGEKKKFMVKYAPLYMAE